MACECGREPDPGICQDTRCPLGFPPGHCRCIQGHVPQSVAVSAPLVAKHRPSVKHAVHGDHWWFRCTCGITRWSTEWRLALEYALVHAEKVAATP